VTEIDIPVGPALQSALDLPSCDVLRIPLPSPTKVQLPTGTTLQAFTDMSKGVPNDCAMVFSLLGQASPLLAAMECPLRILKLLKPLVDIIQGLPKPPTPALLKDFVDAATELAPCFLIPTPANLLPFVVDLLKLIKQLLNCMVTQLRSVRDVMQGMALRFELAEGNDALMATLECAQENVSTSLENLTTAVEPIGAILGLMSPIMGMAGLPEIELPAPGAAPQDVEALDGLIDTLQGVVDLIDAIPGVGGA
jgi:hypothetical protein